MTRDSVETQDRQSRLGSARSVCVGGRNFSTSADHRRDYNSVGLPFAPVGRDDSSRAITACSVMRCVLGNSEPIVTVRTILTQPLICKAEDLYPSGGYERGPRNSFYCFGHFKKCL